MADIQKHSEISEKTSPRENSPSNRLSEEAYQTMRNDSVQAFKSISGRETNANLAGEQAQSKNAEPMDKLFGRTSAIALEKAAEDSLKATEKNVGGFLGKIFFDKAENSLDKAAPRATKQLAAALESNEVYATTRWNNFDKDHKYDSILADAKVLAANKKQSSETTLDQIGQHGPRHESYTEAQPAASEGDKDGVSYLKGALSGVLYDKFKSGNNELSKEDLQTAVTRYTTQGDQRMARALQFGVDNFDNLRSLSGDGDSLFGSHKGISPSDISELTNYQSYLNSGKWSGNNPLYSDAIKQRATTVGTALGALAEGASFLTGVGEAVTLYSALGGAAAGGTLGAGMGAYLDFSDPYYSNASTDKKIAMPIATTAGGAVGGAIAGAAWGPLLGRSAADAAASSMTEKIWNFRHRTEFENMYGQMQKL